MTKLFMKNQEQITLGSNQVHYKPQPGTMIIFPGYVPHEFSVDAGLEPFRFIHWNIKVVETAISKERSNNNEFSKK
jgi:hypothetical protein